MSKIADKLRAVHIFNEYEISRPGGVFISRRASEPFSSAAWIVHIQGKRLKHAERDGGGRAFIIKGRADVKPCLERAIEWCKEHLGVYYFVKSPFGGGNMVQEKYLKEAIKKSKEGDS